MFYIRSNQLKIAAGVTIAPETLQQPGADLKGEFGTRRAKRGGCRERLIDEIRSGGVVKPALSGESGRFRISELATY
jgi:hypothetical protein